MESTEEATALNEVSEDVDTDTLPDKSNNSMDSTEEATALKEVSEDVDTDTEYLLDKSNNSMESTEEATALKEVSDDVDTDTEYLPDKSDNEPFTPETGIRHKPTWNSEAWKYFTVVDLDKKLAKCRACKGIFSFTTTVSNLKKHTRKKHPELISGEREIPEGSDEKEVLGWNDNDLFTPEEIIQKPKWIHEVWKYFTVVDLNTKLAKCKACRGIFNFTTSLSNLKKHMGKKHPELISGEREIPEGSDDKEVLVWNDNDLFTPEKIIQKPKWIHEVWKYFTVVDLDTKLAKCKACKGIFSFTTTLSNLKKHTRKKHPELISDEREIPEGSDEKEVLVWKGKSPFWTYFKILSKALKIASCLICKARLDYENYEDLAKHLIKKHPEIKLRKSNNVIITNEGDIFEVADDAVKSEPDYAQNGVDDIERNDSTFHSDEVDALEETAVEYLEENIFIDHSPQPAKRRRKSRTTSDKIITKSFTRTNERQEERKGDSLDMFGKYVVSLLRKLPKHKSDRLQAEMISKIMAAQLDYDAKINKKISSNNSYPSCIRVNRISRNSS